MGCRPLLFFVDKGEAEDCCLEAKSMVQLFKEELKKNQDVISQVFTFGDIEENERRGKAVCAAFSGRRLYF